MASQLRPDSDPAPFVHPADAMDARDASTPNPFDAQIASLADRRAAAEIFGQLFADCIPAGSPYKGGRRWKAGYNRMVAIAYVTAPELFVGMEPREIALELGISQRMFLSLRVEVKATLAMRAEAAGDSRSRARAHNGGPVAPNPANGISQKARVLPRPPAP